MLIEGLALVTSSCSPKPIRHSRSYTAINPPEGTISYIIGRCIHTEIGSSVDHLNFEMTHYQAGNPSQEAPDARRSIELCKDVLQHVENTVSLSNNP